MNKERHHRKLMARRARRTRIRIRLASVLPRLAVFRSNKTTSVQLIDDGTGKTLAFASSREIPASKGKKTKSEIAFLVGEHIAEKAKALHIAKVIFDRRSYRYHGRVRSVAEGARKGGLTI